ncbi:MAG: tetrathionate reductase family octaheme c-type cytochrome [Thermoanaerobacteraceae bacterium]|nr:tetrathionate reductase family octaheme c-type cytochrome [Thermoanaerobacteraceae bacterium]
MKKLLAILLITVAAFVLLTGCSVDTDTPGQQDTNAAEDTGQQEAAEETDKDSGAVAVDHSQLTGPFETPQDVTRQCLTCHSDVAADIMQTYHWNWAGSNPNIVGHESDTDLGKKNGINNFCIATASNEPVCTKCHIGYGPEFAGEENIDCLVCHATNGQYQKGKNGMPAEGVDLVAAAQSVGKPTVKNCGTCHFYAGGGDAVKQGDLDSTLLDATAEHDVHLGGQGMACVDCHAGDNHKIKGTSIHVEPTEGSVGCDSCHGSEPHENGTLNNHLNTVACQTCHIPTFARGQATKIYWDWSTAGQDKEATKDKYGKETYNKKKGSFVWAKDVTPTYAWYNGKVDRYLVGDPINENGVTVLAKPVGSIDDPDAKIYPFKVMKGKQPADAKYNYLLTPNVVGFWQHFDWDKALADGAAASGLEYSGEYKFVETEMYLGINHEVIPKENALNCMDCHNNENGPIDFKALGYEGDPMKVGGRNLKTN